MVSGGSKRMNGSGYRDPMQRGQAVATLRQAGPLRTDIFGDADQTKQEIGGMGAANIIVA